MGWISDIHKKIYFDAFSAICDDVKDAASSVTSSAVSVISKAPENVKSYTDYLVTNYYPNSFFNNQNNSDENEEKTDEENEDQKIKNDDIFSNEESTDDDLYIYQKDSLLFKLNTDKKYVSKIWIIDQNNIKTPLSGKLHMFPRVKNIIHRWFRYNRSEDKKRYRWYPKETLYTELRNSTIIMKQNTAKNNRLYDLKYVVFVLDENENYVPIPYQ